MTSRYHTRSNSAKKSSDGPNHSHIVSNTNTNSKGLSRHRPSNNDLNIINRSPGIDLWHDHVAVRGQECNSGLFVERRREGINDFSLDKPNVHIQSSFHHTTGSNSFIPQSINFSISHFNFIDNMDNRASVGSQSILPPSPLHKRQFVLPTENLPTILPSQHHISHREVPTHLCTSSSSSLLTLVQSVHVQQHQHSISSRSLVPSVRVQSHQDSISSTHGLFQNQNMEIASVTIPEHQSPIFENSGLESPNFAEMSRPQQVRTDDHLF